MGNQLKNLFYTKIQKNLLGLLLALVATVSHGANLSGVIKDKNGWNDGKGAGMISTLSVMLEQLGIYNDTAEHMMFAKLTKYWKMEFTPRI